MNSEIIAALISSIVGGLLVAVVNYVLNRGKADAEIERIRAEAEKLRAETKAILTEAVSKTVQETLEGPPKTTIYDGIDCDPFDFRERSGKAYKDGEFVGPRAEGNLNLLENGVLEIERINTEGRYHIYLRRYFNNGVHGDHLEQDVTIDGDRVVRICCQAKTTQGEHTLYFSFRGEDGKAFGRKFIRGVSEDQWTDIDFICELPPDRDYRLRITDQDVSEAPSSIYISNLRLTERSSRI